MTESEFCVDVHHSSFFHTIGRLKVAHNLYRWHRIDDAHKLSAKRESMGLLYTPVYIDTWVIIY